MRGSTGSPPTLSAGCPVPRMTGCGIFKSPGGLALFEKCLDAFAPFGRRARLGDAANGQRLERVIDRAARDFGYQPFRARL